MGIDVNALDRLPAEDSDDVRFVCDPFPTCTFTYPVFGSGAAAADADPVE
jgi:hypothetical protein